MKIAGIKIEIDIIPQNDGMSVTFNFKGNQVIMNDEGTEIIEARPIPSHETVFHTAEFLKSLAIEHVRSMELDSGAKKKLVIPAN